METSAALKILQVHEDRLRKLRTDITNGAPVDISNHSLRPTLYSKWKRFNQHAHVLRGDGIGKPSHRLLESQLDLMTPEIGEHVVDMLDQRPTQWSKQSLMRIFENCHREQSSLRFDVLHNMVSLLDDREIARDAIPTRRKDQNLYPVMRDYMEVLLDKHKPNQTLKQRKQFLGGELKKVTSFLSESGFTTSDVQKLKQRGKSVLSKINKAKLLAQRLPKSTGKFAMRILNLIQDDLAGKQSSRSGSYKNITGNIKVNQVKIQRRLKAVQDQKQKRQEARAEKKRLKEQEKAEKKAARERKQADRLAEKERVRQEKKAAREAKKQQKHEATRAARDKRKSDRVEKTRLAKEDKCREGTKKHPEGFESCEHRDRVMKALKEKRMKDMKDKVKRRETKKEKRAAVEKQKQEQRNSKAQSQKARYISQIMKLKFDVVVSDSLQPNVNYSQAEREKLELLKQFDPDKLKAELDEHKTAAKVRKQEQKKKDAEKNYVSSEQLQSTALAMLTQSMDAVKLVEGAPSDQLLKKFNSCMAKCSAVLSPNDQEQTKESEDEVRVRMKTKYGGMNDQSLKKEAQRLEIEEGAAEQFDMNPDNVVKFALRDSEKRSGMLEMMVAAATHEHMFKHNKDYRAKYEREVRQQNQRNKEERLKQSSFSKLMQFSMMEDLSSEELINKAKEFENDSNVAPEFITALKESVAELSGMKSEENKHKEVQKLTEERIKLKEDIDSYVKQLTELEAKDDPTSDERELMQKLTGKHEFSINKLADVEKNIKDPEMFYRQLVVSNIGSILQGSDEKDGLEVDTCQEIEEWCQDKDFSNDETCHDSVMSSKALRKEMIKGIDHEQFNNDNFEDEVKQCIGPPYDDKGMTMDPDEDEEDDDDFEPPEDDQGDDEEDSEDDVEIQSDDESDAEIQKRMKETQQQVQQVQSNFDNTPEATQTDPSYDVLFGSETSTREQQKMAENMTAGAIVALADELKQEAQKGTFGSVTLKQLLMDLDIDNDNTIVPIIDHLYPQKGSQTAFAPESKHLVKLLARKLQPQEMPAAADPSAVLQNPEVINTVVSEVGGSIEKARAVIQKNREEISAEARNMDVQAQVREWYTEDLVGENLGAKVLKALLMKEFQRRPALIVETLVEIGSDEAGGGKQAWAKQVMQKAADASGLQLDLADEKKLNQQVNDLEESDPEALDDFVDDMLEQMNREQLLDLFATVRVHYADEQAEGVFV
jgi:hypothetical protein